MDEFTKEELKILRYGLDLIPRKDNQLIIELEDKIESMLDRISCIHLYQPILEIMEQKNEYK